MGKFSRGITFAEHDYVSAAKLYALIDTAIASSDAFPGSPTLYDIVMGDLATVRAFHTASSPSSPATNDLRVGSDGALDRYNGTTWEDLTDDYTYLVNTAAFTLVTGTPVTPDPASAVSCQLWAGSGVCFEPLGISAGVFGNGVTAKIQIRGIAPVRLNSPLSVAINDHLRIAAAGATGLSTTSTVTSDVLGILIRADVDSPLSGNGIAILVH